MAIDDPFFLTVSFTNPHDPWQPREADWQAYADDDIGLPQVGEIPRELADPHSLRLREMFGMGSVAVSDDAIRTARRAYYACVSYVDGLVGRLLRRAR